MQGQLPPGLRGLPTFSSRLLIRRARANVESPPLPLPPPPTS